MITILFSPTSDSSFLHTYSGKAPTKVLGEICSSFIIEELFSRILPKPSLSSSWKTISFSSSSIKQSFRVVRILRLCPIMQEVELGKAVPTAYKNKDAAIHLSTLPSSSTSYTPMGSYSGLDEAEQRLLVVDVNENEHGSGNESSDAKIQIRELSKVSDKSVPILNKVNVDIPRGVIMGVIGPSGSGKSTFLRALNRLWEPPSKTVFLDGQDIGDLDVLALRRRVGMLFQLPALFEGTVADNIRYGPQLKGKKLTDNEVYKLLTLADLDSTFFSKSGGELSVGQAQRVALARTLANEPEVLLLDEPTSALDPISTQNIEDVLVKLKKEKGMTIVMVSHSIKQIQRIADVVCLLVGGEIVEILKPDKLSEAKHPMALRFLELSN